MLKNYLLISFRSLRKHFSYSLINILGLGLGLATCLLLVTWIRHELSFDKFHEKADRIYRFSLEYGNGGQTASTSVSPTALLPAILSLPEAETGGTVLQSFWKKSVDRTVRRQFISRIEVLCCRQHLLRCIFIFPLKRKSKRSFTATLFGCADGIHREEILWE